MMIRLIDICFFFRLVIGVFLTLNVVFWIFIEVVLCVFRYFRMIKNASIIYNLFNNTIKK